MRLVQFRAPDERRQVGLVSEDGLYLQVLREASRVYDLALEADRLGIGLERLISDRVGGERVNYDQLAAENR